jgi:hypothetical protein
MPPDEAGGIRSVSGCAFCPFANNSKSDRLTRKAPGRISTFSNPPDRKIRQSVARLTPRNFAPAPIPRSNGPVEVSLASRRPPFRISSILTCFSGSACKNFMSLSFEFREFMAFSIVG